MKRLLAVVLLGPLVAFADNLKPIPQPRLADALGWLQELTPNESSPSDGPAGPWPVRLFAVDTESWECQGTVQSCPDVRLYISVSTGDLGDHPVLFEMPLAKGWRFVRWMEPSDRMTRFVIRTALPESNMEPAAAKKWRPIEYQVSVSPDRAVMERK